MDDQAVEPRRATAQELQAILVTVRCGLAGPHVQTLLGHIAALAQERDALQEQLSIANDRLDIAWEEMSSRQRERNEDEL